MGAQHLLSSWRFVATSWLTMAVGTPLLSSEPHRVSAFGHMFQRPAYVDAIPKSGTTMAGAEQIAQAFDGSFNLATPGSIITIANGSRSISFILGAYVAIRPSGPEPIDAAPFKVNGRPFVPLRLTVETLGGKLVGSGPSLAIQFDSEAPIPVRLAKEPALPSDPFDRLLYRLNNAPIEISENARGALIQDVNMELLDSSLELVKPAMPALKALSDSKIISLFGDLPGLGTPVKIVQDLFGAGGEVVSILEWYLSVDERFRQPMRKGVLACDKQLTSRSRTDLNGTISGLEAIGGVAKEYQSMGLKAAAAAMKYKASFDRFQLALQKFTEVHGGTMPDPTSSKGRGPSQPLSSQLQKLFGGLMRQANDLSKFASDALADARAAKVRGGKS